MTYAAETSVPVERSKSELDKLLSKAGASQRMMGSDDEKGEAWVLFKLTERQVRMRVPLPKLGDKTFDRDGRGSRRSPDSRRAAYEQACRTRWRALVLLTKAKLEAVAMGQTTVEREFLADIYLPDGRTVHQALAADIEKAYLGGTMPPLLGPVSK